ncbi:MAG: hypothetical protein PVF87_02020 [Acidimicrobiia bacterium]|jgi:hypothetical protein
MQDSKHLHDLENTVVAILDSGPAQDKALHDLDVEGYRYEVLRGETGRTELGFEEPDGLIDAVKEVVELLGDEYLVLDRLDHALVAGRTVVLVDTPPETATKAIEILRRCGAEQIWRFGDWTFTSVKD